MAGTISMYAGRDIEAFFLSHRANVDPDLVSRLVSFIDGTRHSLDCAIYDLRHPEVIGALKRLHRTRPRVRLQIAHDDHPVRSKGPTADPKPRGTAELLALAKLPATPIHHGSDLMHNKFLVRDGRWVWTGSANFTEGGLQYQDNNCLVLHSTALAERYAKAFRNILAWDGSGPAPTPPSVAPIRVGRATVRLFFAPRPKPDEVEQAINAVLAEGSSVRLMVFVMSDKEILDSLQRFQPAHGGSRILGVYDRQGMADARPKPGDPRFWFLKDRRFREAPSHAFQHGPHGESDFSHNKVMVVDDHTVITGSYNFSEHAETNGENVLIIESPPLAAAYAAYFDRLFRRYRPRG